MIIENSIINSIRQSNNTINNNKHFMMHLAGKLI